MIVYKEISERCLLDEVPISGPEDDGYWICSYSFQVIFSYDPITLSERGYNFDFQIEKLFITDFIQHYNFNLAAREYLLEELLRLSPQEFAEKFAFSRERRYYPYCGYKKELKILPLGEGEFFLSERGLDNCMFEDIKDHIGGWLKSILSNREEVPGAKTIEWN